jgi:hypothetical protein
VKAIKQDTKRVFFAKGTCSQTLFFLLNREFGFTKENEERAADPLAGGLMMRGHQCGMLWGSALAAGAESFRRHNDSGQAIAVAITATRHLMESFLKRAKTVNCRDITGCDLTSKFGMAKLMLKTISRGFIYSHCFNLAEQWAPEAIQSATSALSGEQTDVPRQPLSCASEVARKMGASDEEMVMVAGFAGGMGLSGNACGALGAAVWMKTLAWCKQHPGETPPYFDNPDVKKILKTFCGAAGSEMLCRTISGRCFKTLEDHTEFIRTGGCDNLIDLLARS